MIRPLLWLPLAVVSLAAMPALAQDNTLEKQARKLHAMAGGEYCDVEGAYDDAEAYASWTFSYQPTWSSDAAPEEVTLIRIFCMAGAYNITHAWYVQRANEGLTPLAFAQPVVTAKYENDDSLEGALEGVTITGMGAVTTLVNSDFDPETKTISATALWRGIGDASAMGVWSFTDGTFALARYDVDASYDEEMNPETLVDYAAQ